MGYEVDERADVVEVRGASGDDVRQALELLAAFRLRQRTSAREVSATLVAAAVGAGLPLVPSAALSHAERLAEHRAGLLAQGAYSTSDIGRLTGASSSSAVRTWMARQRAAHALFTVKLDGRTFVPAFQFTDDGRLRPELQPLIEVLVEHRVDGWELWTWLTSRSSLLSGETPESVARVDQARAVRAAHRFAAQIAA